MGLYLLTFRKTFQHGQLGGVLFRLGESEVGGEFPAQHFSRSQGFGRFDLCLKPH
jgi:hypothetical protein